MKRPRLDNARAGLFFGKSSGREDRGLSRRPQKLHCFKKFLLFDNKSGKMHKRLILLDSKAISAFSNFVIFGPSENICISMLFGRQFLIKFF